MDDKSYRITNNPEWLASAVNKTEHVIVKSDAGTFFCQIHRCDAHECATERRDNLLWRNSLDRGKYVATVVRTEPYRGKLTLARSDEIVFEQNVPVRYDAPFGADEEDIREWRDRCVSAADDDYRRRGEIPPP